MTKEDRKNGRMAYLILAIDGLITTIGVAMATTGLIDPKISAYLIMFLFSTYGLYLIMSVSCLMRNNNIWLEIRKETALAISLCVFIMLIFKYLLDQILTVL